jgi:PAS domain S-box-containing protein
MNSDRSSNQVPKALELLRQQAQDLYESFDASIKHPSPQSDACLDELLTHLWMRLEQLHTDQEKLQHQQQQPDRQLSVAQQAQESQYTYYQELFECAPASYIITNLDGKILEANRAATQLLRANLNELIGKPLIHFIAGADQPMFAINLANLAHLRWSHSVSEWEIRLRRHDSSKTDPSDISVALAVSAVHNQDGIPIRLRWQLLDITNYKQAETQAQQLQVRNMQMVETDRLKAQFLAVMSHELKTPIHIMNGFAQLLRRRFQAQQDLQSVDMTERIVGSSQHLLALVDDILDFSQLQSKRLKLKIEPFDLADLVTLTVDELQPLAKRKNLVLQSRLPQSCLSIVGDAARVQQIIANLLSNAIKFTNHGMVTIEVMELSEERVAIEVQDTGIGIAQSDLNFIFQAFCQLSQSLSRQYDGTGLGLSITHALVELMQGSIAVKSALGQGTTFRVELPRHTTLATD